MARSEVGDVVEGDAVVADRMDVARHQIDLVRDQINLVGNQIDLVGNPIEPCTRHKVGIVKLLTRSDTQPGACDAAVTTSIAAPSTCHAQFGNVDGHVLAVAWPDPLAVPIGIVSLFQKITYAVQFAKDIPGIWWDLGSAHYSTLLRGR